MTRHLPVRVVIGALLAIPLLVSSCAESPTAELQTISVDRGPIETFVDAVGTLQPLALTKVSSQLSGQIAEVLADFNDRVAKGQILARLDEQSYRARVQEAQAELDVARSQLAVYRAGLARAQAQLSTSRAHGAVLESEQAAAAAEERKLASELDRQRALARRGTSSTSELETAQSRSDAARAQRQAAEARCVAQEGEVAAALAEVAIAEAQIGNAEALMRQREAALDEARVHLARTAIRSPLDGIVIRRDVEPGQTVASSLQAPTLFTLAGDLRSMRVETRVDEADIGQVRSGQEVRFQVDAYPERSFDGRVVEIRMAPEVVQNVVTYSVIVDAPNTDRALLPGMTATVRIAIDTLSDVLRIPNAALRFRPPAGWPEGPGPAEGRTRAWVAGEARPRPVDLLLGASDEKYTAVREGDLETGQLVLIGLGGVR